MRWQLRMDGQRGKDQKRGQTKKGSLCVHRNGIDPTKVPEVQLPGNTAFGGCRERQCPAGRLQGGVAPWGSGARSQGGSETSVNQVHGHPRSRWSVPEGDQKRHRQPDQRCRRAAGGAGGSGWCGCPEQRTARSTELGPRYSVHGSVIHQHRALTLGPPRHRRPGMHGTYL